MRKTAVIAGILGMATMGGAAWAVSQGDPVDVEVWAQIDSTLQITIGSATSFDFATVPGGYVGTVPFAFTVTNTGGGPTQTYSLNVVEPAGWTIAGTPGLNVFAMDAQFNSVAPGSWGVSHALSAGVTPSGASPGGQFAGDQDGVNTDRWETVNMWVRFQAPTSVSGAGLGRKRIQINIDANTP